MKRPVIRMREVGTLHVGEIDCPMDKGMIKISTLGFDPLSALRRAASTALQLTTDPAIAPLLPPGVAQAAQLARTLSKMSLDDLKQTARAAASVTERKLARTLLRRMRERDDDDDDDDGIPDAAESVGAPPRRGRGGGGRSRGGYKTRATSPRGSTRTRTRTRTYGTSARAAAARDARDAYGTRDQYGNPVPPQGGRPNPYHDPQAPYGRDPYTGLPLDQNGYPVAQPGHAPPGYNPGEQVNPLDAYAMQAWGQQGFDQPQSWNPTDYQEADDYFEAYEDIAHDWDSSDIIDVTNPPDPEADESIDEGEE